MTDEKTEPRNSPDRTGLWPVMASARFLYWLLPIIILLCILGTLLPQGEPAAAYAGRFGLWARPLLRLRLNDIFHSPIFLIPLGLLSANLALCSWRRRELLESRPDVFLTHLSILVILAGGMVSGLGGRRGNLPMTEGETLSWVESGNRNFKLPFDVKLEAFRIEYHDTDQHRLAIFHAGQNWTENAVIEPGGRLRLRDGTVTLRVLGYYPDFILEPQGPATRSRSPNNPALRLEIEDQEGVERHWAFAKFRDFHAGTKKRYQLAYDWRPGRIKQFCSDISIIENGRAAERRSICVNHPLRRRGYTLYQAGYDPDAPGFSNIAVSRDPGTRVVYLGFILLSLGLTWTYLTRRDPS